MAQRKPLVIISGQVQELPAGDTTAGAVGGSGSTVYAEPVIVLGGNQNVVYQNAGSMVPDFVLTSSGDIVCASGS